MKQEIEISAGRSLFGINPVNYSEVRPDYPEEFYQRLVACSCNDLLDVASGDGRIARQLRGRTAMNVTLLEPDDRFSPFLDDIDGAAVHCASFEEAVFDRQSFDLITVGTAFHWLDSVTRISRVSGLLKPGGTLPYFGMCSVIVSGEILFMKPPEQSCRIWKSALRLSRVRSHLLYGRTKGKWSLRETEDFNWLITWSSDGPLCWMPRKLGNCIQPFPISRDWTITNARTYC